MIICNSLVGHLCVMVETFNEFVPGLSPFLPAIGGEEAEGGKTVLRSLCHGHDLLKLGQDVHLIQPL